MSISGLEDENWPGDYLNNVILKDGLQGIGIFIQEEGVSARVIISEVKVEITSM